jgi:hypothetical protein
MPEEPRSYESEDLLALLFMAFGQGAGSMYATPGAVRIGRQEYARAIQPKAWDQHAPYALEYARALGRVAAHLALQDGATAIDEPHFRSASELVRQRQIAPWFCPYCPPVKDWLPGRPQDFGPAGGKSGPTR